MTITFCGDRVSADVTEDLEIELSWIIRANPKGTHMDLYKQVAEGEEHRQKRRHG